MVDATPHDGGRSPLGHLGAAGPWNAPLALSEMRFRTILNLRGAVGDLADPVKSVTGCTLPTTPNTVATAGDHAVLWLGPDEWLVVTEADHVSPQQALESALSGVFATVVDLSDNYACIRISGDPARTVLEKGWSPDLHPRVFGPGQCGQSMLAHAAVVLHQTGDEPPTYELYVRPSFAQYAWDWLTDASLEFGYRVV